MQYCRAGPKEYAHSALPCADETWPRGREKCRGQWWSSPKRTNFPATPLRWDHEHTTGVRSRSEFAQSPHRCASPVTHWHRQEWNRSEEHTSELQSHSDLVCRL